MAIVNRLLLLVVAILAGIQIVTGIENYSLLAITYFTFSFGIFLVSALLMLLMGVDIIEHDTTALIASTLPLGFSLGLVAEFFSVHHVSYLVIITLLFAGLIFNRFLHRLKRTLLYQIILHGLSGLILFILPIILLIQGTVGPRYLWISFGTGLVAIGGMALGLMKSGKPVLNKEQIYSIFPGVLLLAVLGFSLGIGSR